MARKPGQILPFRIPFFRIFYSTTYTTVYIVCLCFLAITPVSLLWQAIVNSAQQYTVIIGGTYVLTASIAIFIYASRVYTNRTTMAGMGKAYIPVEPGEVGKGVRKMIAGQLERSAIVAWESRPRDLVGEILLAEEHGILPPETSSVGRDDYTVGREIPIDPAQPPWGDVQHLGWSSPARKGEGEMPNVQFAPVIAELPNLIEARAVSLAPADPGAIGPNGEALADPVVVEILQRPETMGMRDYLTQLSYLGLVNPYETGQAFLNQYENARFSGLPINQRSFKGLMSAFAELLAGMTALEPEIVDQIRLQAGDEASLLDDHEQSPNGYVTERILAASPHSPGSSIVSPVTARTAPSRTVTPYLTQESKSRESLSSVIQYVPKEDMREEMAPRNKPASVTSSNLESDQSETGSVVRHSPSSEIG